MAWLASGQALRAAGRKIEVPFRLRLEGKAGRSELLCTEVLRVLPGKRVVLCAMWKYSPVVVKVFLDRMAAQRHCAREAKGLCALAKAGLNTPEILFKGRLLHEDSPVLVSRKLEAARKLSEAWNEDKQDKERSELLCRVSRAVADQHAAGLSQNDPHWGNFLLAGERLFAVDGDAISSSHPGKPLSKAKSLKNLALFFAQLDPRFDRFLSGAFRAYVGKRGWRFRGALHAKLDKKIAWQRKRRQRAYLKKIYRECSAFVCHTNWSKFMVCDRAFYNEAMVRVLADPDAAIGQGDGIKNGRSSTLALLNLEGRQLVAKRYNIKNRRHACSRALRSTRASKAWRNAHRMAMLGIQTPQPIALVEKRRGPLRSAAYLFMEYVQGPNAYQWLRSAGAEKAGSQGLTRQFMQILQLLSNARTSHGDLKASNFIAFKEKLWMLDLDSMRQHRFRWRFRRAFKRDWARWMQNWADLPDIARIFEQEFLHLKI
jgi:tRNA A-37 threonylcarbamoyl transferase component Bud32